MVEKAMSFLIKSIELKSNIQQNGKVQITNKVTDPTLSFESFMIAKEQKKNLSLGKYILL